MSSELARRKCLPCQGGVPPLAGDELHRIAAGLSNGWAVVEDHHILKSFSFADFAEALEFVNRVGAIAEEENHHPDIFLAWGKVTITLYTHKIDGLAEADFILAAKVDELL